MIDRWSLRSEEQKENRSNEHFAPEDVKKTKFQRRITFFHLRLSESPRTRISSLAAPGRRAAENGDGFTKCVRRYATDWYRL